jgi:uncharacterized membrane protein YfcA
VQATAGLGFALVLSPAAFALLEPEGAILAVTVLGLTLNALVLFGERRRPRVAWGEVRPFLVASVPGSVCGVLVLRALPKPALQVAVGAAVLAAVALAVTWAVPDTRAGELTTVALIAGSAITLGRLLAGVAPLPLLKAGVIAMAAVDAWLVFSGRLEQPNAVLIAATPGLGLPQLQSASFAGAGLGYGDFFAAAVVGGILAAERGPQLAAATGAIVVSLCWDQLFLVYDVLPATIPPAVALLAVEARRARLRGRRPT